MLDKSVANTIAVMAVAAGGAAASFREPAERIFI
jgi:hypothetical protein